MSNAFFEIPIPINEPVKEFRDGSIEKERTFEYDPRDEKKSGGHTNDH